MPEIYKSLIRPLMFRLNAETAHEIGIESLRVGLATEAAREIARLRYRVDSFPDLKRFGLSFPNPLGVAAGFDKNGTVVNQLASLGFGFVEVGTVTLRPQKGNERPRLFRLPQQRALVNRLGFNNEGATAVADRLRRLQRSCVVGVNIGRNKDVANEEAVENYLATLEIVHDVADYVTVNISSPNTPNLRELQRADNLDELLGALQKRNRELGPKPLLVKIAPDITESEIADAVDISKTHAVAGIIATNTTTTRPGLSTSEVERVGAGGLSGGPLHSLSTQVISKLYRASDGTIPVVGVGGIFTAEDAFEKIAAGASLLQAYTGFVYGGPGFARDINQGLAKILEKRGFGCLDDAVGSGV